VPPTRLEESGGGSRGREGRSGWIGAPDQASEDQASEAFAADPLFCALSGLGKFPISNT
jgi:hypothetical protein